MGFETFHLSVHNSEEFKCCLVMGN